MASVHDMLCGSPRTQVGTVNDKCTEEENGFEDLRSLISTFQGGDNNSFLLHEDHEQSSENERDGIEYLLNSEGTSLQEKENGDHMPTEKQKSRDPEREKHVKVSVLEPNFKALFFDHDVSSPDEKKSDNPAIEEDIGIKSDGHVDGEKDFPDPNMSENKMHSFQEEGVYRSTTREKKGLFSDIREEEKSFSNSSFRYTTKPTWDNDQNSKENLLVSSRKSKDGDYDHVNSSPIGTSIETITGVLVSIKNGSVSNIEIENEEVPRNSLDPSSPVIEDDEDTIIYEIKHEEKDEAIQSEIESYLELTGHKQSENGEISKEFTFSSLRELASTFSKGKKRGKTRKGRKRGRTRVNDMKCPHCNHQSNCKGDMDKHIRYVHGESVFKCPHNGCTFTTKYPNNIRHHMSKHTDVRPFSCPICDMAFKRGYHLKNHMRTHSDEKPYKCSKCDFTAKRNWEVTSHYTNKHTEERKFQCEICGFRLKARSDWLKHTKRHAKEKKFKCNHCSKSFTVAGDLKKHIKLMHEKPEYIPCTYEKCTAKFKVISSLKKHIRNVHEGIKDFICTVCSRKFSAQSNLEAHLVTHDKSRPHLCPFCPYRGREEDHVLGHIGSMHGKLKTYPCKICHVKFKKYAGLAQHYNTEKHKRNLRFSLPPSDKEIKVEPASESDSETTYTLPKIVSVGTVIKEEPGINIKMEIDHD